MNNTTPSTNNQLKGPTVAEIGRHILTAAQQTQQLPKPVGRLSEITAEELLNRKIEQIECLVEPFLQKVGLAALAGSSDTGKSTLLRQLAFAIATGELDFLGFPIKARHKSTIFVSTEDDEQAIAYLLNALNKTKQVQPSDCGSLRFVFDTHDLLNELDNRLTDQPADLVIIDAFGDLYNREQNSSNQIRAFLHDYSQLAQKHQCLILFLHHVGKRTEDEPPSKHNILGGQGFEGKMRLVLELRKDFNDIERRHLCIVKGNYLPGEWKEDSFVLDYQDFVFTNTNERAAFESLGRPKEENDGGKAKYDLIQEARKQGCKGEALSKRCGISKGQISKLEKKFGSFQAESLPV